MEDFKKLREEIIEKGNETDSMYIKSLGIFRGLLEITEQIDKKPPIETTNEGKDNKLYFSTDVYRKINDKLVF